MRIANATQKSITANGYDEAAAQVLGIEVDLGQIKSPTAGSGDAYIMGVDSDIGRTARGIGYGTHPSLNDRYTSRPSGWSLDFGIDVGQGLSVASTTWPVDAEPRTKGEFAYYTPLAITNKAYSALAT